MTHARCGDRPGRTFGCLAVAVVALAMGVGVGSGCRSSGTGPVAPSAGIPGAEVPSAPASIEAAAVEMRPVDAWPGSRILRQRVRVEWPSGSEVFDAVLQRRPGELALVGLGPMNLVGFRLALVEGPRIEFENRSGRALPFAPAHILADVQRVFYPWLSEPWSPESTPSEGARRDREPTTGVDCPRGCERSGQEGAIAVWERRVEGRLAERRFAIAERPDAGEVQIRYADWQGEPGFPRRVELENGWFGYRLTIETLEETPIGEG